MYNWTNLALETARLRGASYADVRVMHQRQRDLTTKNGKVGTLAQSESIGLGLGVLANGAWGFAAPHRLSRAGGGGWAGEGGSGGLRGAGGGHFRSLGQCQTERRGDG